MDANGELELLRRIDALVVERDGLAAKLRAATDELDTLRSVYREIAGIVDENRELTNYPKFRADRDSSRPKTRIKELRDERGWTLEELAERTGLSVSQVNRIENDKRDPSMGSLTAIAGAFGVTASRLLDTAEPSDSPGKV